MPGHATHANDDDSHLTTSLITMSHIIHVIVMDDSHTAQIIDDAGPRHP